MLLSAVRGQVWSPAGANGDGDSECAQGEGRRRADRSVSLPLLVAWSSLPWNLLRISTVIWLNFDWGKGRSGGSMEAGKVVE